MDYILKLSRGSKYISYILQIAKLNKYVQSHYIAGRLDFVYLSYILNVFKCVLLLCLFERDRKVNNLSRITCKVIQMIILQKRA